MGQRQIKVNSTPFSSAENVPTGFKGERKPHETFIRAWLVAAGAVGPEVLILDSTQCNNEARPSPQACWSPHTPPLLSMSGNIRAFRGSKEWGERRKGASLGQEAVSLTAACNYQTVTLYGSSDVTTLSPGLENRSIPCSHNLAQGKTTTG